MQSKTNTCAYWTFVSSYIVVIADSNLTLCGRWLQHRLPCPSTISWNLFRLMCIESVIQPSHPLGTPFFSIFPGIMVSLLRNLHCYNHPCPPINSSLLRELIWQTAQDKAVCKISECVSTPATVQTADFNPRFHKLFIMHGHQEFKIAINIQSSVRCFLERLPLNWIYRHSFPIFKTDTSIAGRSLEWHLQWVCQALEELCSPPKPASLP